MGWKSGSAKTGPPTVKNLYDRTPYCKTSHFSVTPVPKLHGDGSVHSGRYKPDFQRKLLPSLSSTDGGSKMSRHRRQWYSVSSPYTQQPATGPRQSLMTSVHILRTNSCIMVFTSSSHLRARAHTHTPHTRARAHTHTTHARARTHTRTNTTRAHAHTRPHTRTTHTASARAHTHTHHTRARADTHTHAQIPHARTHTHAHTHVPHTASARARARTHTHTHTRTHTNTTRAHAHTRPHTHTHTYTHTHTHTHTKKHSDCRFYR